MGAERRIGRDQRAAPGGVASAPHAFPGTSAGMVRSCAMRRSAHPRARRRPFPVLVALLGGAALGQGCSSYRAPRLEIVSATVTEMTSDGAALSFDLTATNPNAVALPLRGVEYRLLLGGREVFSGVRAAEATLAAGSTQTITLPASVPAAEVPPGASPYTLEGRVTYITPGALAETLFDLGVRRPRAGFGGRGTVEFGSPSGPADVTREPAPGAPQGFSAPAAGSRP